MKGIITLLGLFFLFSACRKDPEINLDQNVDQSSYINEGQTNWTKHPFWEFPNYNPGYQANLGMRIADVYFFGQTCYITGEKDDIENEPFITKSSNNGLTWNATAYELTLCGAGMSLDGAFFINSEHGFAATNCMAYRRINETTDGGNTWSEIEPYGNLYDTPDLFFYIDSLHFIIHNKRTSDGGISWQNLTLINGATCYYFEDTLHGFCAASNGILAETFDYGLTWDTLIADPAYVFRCLSMSDPNTIFAGGNKILKSSDGGTNWSEVYSNSTVMDIQFVNGSIGFAAAQTEGGWYLDQPYSGDILKTTDGGSTWQINYHSEFIGFTTIQVIDDQTIVSAGNQIDIDPNVQHAYYIITHTQGN